MVNKLFSIRRLRIGVLFSSVGLIFVFLFLVFFREEGINNNVEKGKLRALKSQNVINLKELSSNNFVYPKKGWRITSKPIEEGKDKFLSHSTPQDKEHPDYDEEKEKVVVVDDDDMGEHMMEEYIEELEMEAEKLKELEIEREKFLKEGEEEEEEKDEKKEEKENEDKNETYDKEKEKDKELGKVEEEDEEKLREKIEKAEKEDKELIGEEENFDMKEYSKSVHLESTTPLNFFKLYHRGRNYRDGDDPIGKDCPVPWRWVDNEAESDIIAMNVLDNLGEIMRIENYHYDKSRQKLLLMSMESTSNYNVMLTKKGYFDYMIDYRLDSDVPIPYTYTFFNFSKPALPLKQKGKNGRGLAAAFISNCGASNQRLEFLDELMKYAKIDSFGMCLHNRPVYPEDDAASAWDTKLNTIRKYKFTIAFENSDDRDYVTEKFFQPLEAGSVPIFYGTSNIADFAPPHSYINAKDFASAKELAEYLNFLNENDEEYESYLEWKKTGNIGRNLSRVIEIRKINSICYLLQRIKGMWINPFLTIWDREDVPKKERACRLC